MIRVIVLHQPDPYAEGEQAFWDKIHVGDNPYQYKSQSYNDWEEGWYDAQFSSTGAYDRIQ